MKNRQTDELLILKNELDSMASEVPEKPGDFHESWMRAIEEENMEKQENTPRKKFPWKRSLGIAAAVVFLIGGTAATRDWIAPRSEQVPTVTETYGTYRSAPMAGVSMKAASSDAFVTMDYAAD